MGTRGPKPVSTGLLSTWEFEFYRAFHLLRDGTFLPPRYALPSMGVPKADFRKFIGQLRRMSAAQYWLTTRLVAVELGEKVILTRPPSRTELCLAESARAQEIKCLERALNPPRIEAQIKRRKIWNELVQANTYAALRKPCGRWVQLPDVRAAGMTPFPGHVLTNAAQFLSMKRNKRFPRSNYGDNSRLEYLARGMSGVLCGKSPMTAIERLRNMKHEPGGPLWVTRLENYLLPEPEQYCGCWRCSINKSIELGKMTGPWYENGLKHFMELATTTRVPIQWSEMRTKRF